MADAEKEDRNQLLVGKVHLFNQFSVNFVIVRETLPTG